MRHDMSCYHILRVGSLVATAASLEDAQYAVKVMARDDAEAELAAKYRASELPGRAWLARRCLELEADYTVTWPYVAAGCVA